jgi:phosphoenolpyruvate---glycerone phosphotransferase subunit DhaK
MRKAKKIINDPRQVVPELLEGLIAAQNGRIAAAPGSGGRALVRAAIPQGKVALLTGGGSGHEPTFPGLVGENMADGAACGEIFAAPSPDVILAAAKAVHRGKGVIFEYNNYAGDVMNFDIAAEMAAAEGIEVKTVLNYDDVASAPRESRNERRGVAGNIFVLKIGGAVTARAATIGEAVRVMEKARDNVRSMGVAVAAGSVPETGELTFELPDDEIEIGMGGHGEPGVLRAKMLRADDLVQLMMDRILPDLPFASGDRVCVLLNNLGATTMMELLIVNRKVHEILRRGGVAVHDTLVGSFATCQEMAGFSVSLLRLDDELRRYYDMPASCLGLTKGAGAA